MQQLYSRIAVINLIGSILMCPKIGFFCCILIVYIYALSNIRLGYTFQHTSAVEQPSLEDHESIEFQYHKLEFTTMPFSKISSYCGLILFGFPPKDIYDNTLIQLLNTDPSIQYERHDFSISVASIGAGLMIGYLLKLSRDIHMDLYVASGYTRYFIDHENFIIDWNNTITSKWGNIDKSDCFEFEFGLRPVIKAQRWYFCFGAGYKCSKFMAHERLKNYELKSNNPKMYPQETTYLSDEYAYPFTINGTTISLTIGFNIWEKKSET